MLGEFSLSFNRLQSHTLQYVAFVMKPYHTFHLVLSLKLKPVIFSAKW